MWTRTGELCVIAKERASLTSRNPAVEQQAIDRIVGYSAQSKLQPANLPASNGPETTSNRNAINDQRVDRKQHGQDPEEEGKFGKYDLVEIEQEAVDGAKGEPSRLNASDIC